MCPLDCPDCCGLVATVTDGRVIHLGGDPDHPYTGGVLCRKMRRYPERLYGRDRILYPAKRIGRKGEGKFSRISWDEALTTIADQFQEIISRFGGEAILPYVYAGNMGLINRFAGYPFFHKLGATRLQETICSATAGAGWQKHLGSTPGCPPENAVDAELIVAWGINIKVSNLHFWPYVASARKRGAKLLVIDPYKNETAKSADLFVQVKPGGDVALALGICKALLAAELYDTEFINSSTTGFAQFATYLDTVAWSALEDEAGICQEIMAELAELLGRKRRTFIRLGLGLSRNSRGGMAVRAISSLAATLGLFGGGPGRGVLLTSRGFRGKTELLTYPVQPAPRQINMIHLGHALNGLTPAVKALVVYNCNPATVAPDSSVVRRGLSREDLFTVVHEQVMTPTARYADIVLPATTFLENRDLYISYGQFYLGTTSPVIEPLGEARSNFDFFQALAAKMGFSEKPFLQTIEERLQEYLGSVTGLAPEAIESALVPGNYCRSTFSCEDGRVLDQEGVKFPFAVPDSSSEPQVASLINATETNDPDLLARYPLCLITPPHRNLLNSTFGEAFVDHIGEALIHPEDGKRYGIKDNAPVRLMNWRGTTLRIARLSEDTQPGLVVAEGLFWGNGGSPAINDLTSQKCSDMGGGAIFHETRIAIVSEG